MARLFATSTITTPSKASAATIAITPNDEILLFILFLLFFYYGWKHRPFEALNAVLLLHPLASASCCSGIVAIVITTTPNNASAATSASSTS